MLSGIFIAFVFTLDNHLMGIHLNSIYFKEIVQKKLKTYLMEKIWSCAPSYVSKF